MPISTLSAGLKRQLTLRFMLVFICAAVLGAAAVLAGYRYMQVDAQRKSADNTTQYVLQHLKDILQGWESDAAKLKAQIDFTRMLHDNDQKRWLKLHAFLAVQEGEVKNFDSIIILKRDGSVAFARGAESADLSPEHIRSLGGDWHLADHQHMLKMVIHQPLWLGDDGQGTLLFIRPLENVTLGSLAAPGTDLFLFAGSQMIASSLGSHSKEQQIDPNFTGMLSIDGKSAEQRWIPVDAAHPEVARIVIRETFTQPLTPANIIGSAMLLLALLSVLLWLVLGRWLAQVTQRIIYLSQATQHFSEKHVVDETTSTLLDKSSLGKDEITDVTGSCREMMHSTEAYQEEHLSFVQTMDMLAEGVLEIDKEGNFLRASSGWHKLAGCTKDHCTKLNQCIHPEDSAMLKKQIASLFSGEKSQVTGRTRLASPENDSWVEYRFVAGAWCGDTLCSVRGVMRDITQSYLLEKRVTYMALHDALTGLPNRVLLEDRFALAINLAERSGRKVAVGFVDLDHFKNINDTFGHKTGDRLLMSVSTAMREAIRSGDTLARWGGDEFIVLLSDLPDLDSVRQAAQKLIKTCAQAVRLDENEFNITFSIGMAIYPNDADNVETLLSQADRAMFHAKEQGRNNVQFFGDMLSKGLGKKDVYIQNRLSSAIKNHQIQTWFQPLVDASTHRVMGFEALARWHDEEYGWISPVTFIPMAENLGLISELGNQVLQETLRQGKRWREMGFNDLKLAVNISRRQLFLPLFVSTLLEGLAENDLPPTSIVLEITESVALSDLEYTSKRLKELADMGFILAIDDFGTGYSSLSQLHDMPVGKLKIDISFVRRVHEPQGAELIQAIIHMAEAFGLSCVAEGVEDQHTAQVLKQYGVHFLQGHFFGKPMPAAEADHYLLSQGTKLVSN